MSAIQEEAKAALAVVSSLSVSDVSDAFAGTFYLHSSPTAADFANT